MERIILQGHDNIQQGISSTPSQRQYPENSQELYLFQSWVQQQHPGQCPQAEWHLEFGVETWCIYFKVNPKVYLDRQITKEDKEYTYLLMKVDALDQRKRTANARISIWQTSVSKWYWSNSKSTQSEVANPSTPAVIFLSLHRKMSAAAHKNLSN